MDQIFVMRQVMEKLYIVLLPTTFIHFFEFMAHARFSPNWTIFSDV
jgi:hypothetical protein